MTMIHRETFLKLIKDSFDVTPIVAILGPRQCGKSTIAKIYGNQLETTVHFLDLEDPEQRSFLISNKKGLDNLNGLIIIDEIQLVPELFQYLRVLVDNSDKKFLILGSASRDLINQSSETLAGRISYVYLHPFSLSEVADPYNLWLRGGFPRSFLAASEEISLKWRKQYITTYLERDLFQFGLGINPELMRSLWIMFAHFHGGIVNYSDIGRSLGVTDTTIRRYLEILTGTFMIRKLRPWFENIKKRQVKSPKIYIRDSGILHSLLGISSTNYTSHPKIGASWEGFALEQVVLSMQADPEDCYFWATPSGGELDLLIVKDGVKTAFEFKYTDSPTITKSMRNAKEILSPSKFTIVTPGKMSYSLGEGFDVMGLGLSQKQPTSSC